MVGETEDAPPRALPRSSLTWPLIITIIGVTGMVWLGKWQLDRRDWKLGLIERIEHRAKGGAVPLSLVKAAWEKDRDVEYYRVRLSGRFLHGYERHLYGIANRLPGWRVVTPMETQGGEIVFVDRGIVPDELKEPQSRVAGQIAGAVTLTGYARGPDKRAWFAPGNNPAANRWFWRDVAGFAAVLPEDARGRALPFMIEAEPAIVPGGWPRAGGTLLTLTNRHFEYALTWFALAGVQLVMFAFYAMRRSYRLQDTPK